MARLKDIPRFGGQDIGRGKFDDWAKKNPREWKKLKKLMDTGRDIVSCQLSNLVGGSHELILRMFLENYVDRYLNYGTKTFPTSYPGIELFTNFNRRYSIIELIYEEELYVLSLENYLDYITGPNYEFENLDFYNEIPEDLIYHFEFNEGIYEYPIVCEDGREFIVGHTSLVRRKNEVSVMLQTGLKIDPSELSTINAKLIAEKLNITDYRKQMGFELNENMEALPRVVHYLESKELWLHTVIVVFDIESKTIDFRYVAKDCNTRYSVLTDSIGALVTGKDLTIKSSTIPLYVNYLKELEKHSGLIEFAKYCMSLPNYVFENEDKIVEVEYATQIKKVIKGVLERRKFRDVPAAVQVQNKSIYYIESPNQNVTVFSGIQDSSFTVEKSGFWKQIGIDEVGVDKKNRPVKGKTWVERNETYYVEKEGRVEVNPNPEYTEPNAGTVYIMRDPGKPQDVFKVGLTRREPEKRQKELSNTSIEDRYYIIFKYATRDCVKAEKIIHQRLDRFRVSSRREFFSCDFKIIKDVCDEVITEINRSDH